MTFGDKFMLVQIILCLMPLMELGRGGGEGGGVHDGKKDKKDAELEST